MFPEPGQPETASQSTFSSTQPPVLPASTPGTQTTCHNTEPPLRAGTLPAVPTALYLPHPLTCSARNPLDPQLLTFLPNRATSAFLSFLRQGPITAAPSSPAFLQRCSTCPAPRDSQPGAGHHPDCRLQGSPSGQTGYISYKLVASTLGVYILGPIQTVMQGNHHLKRYMHPVFPVVQGTAARTRE